MKDQLFERGGNTISMFCRLNINAKKELPLRSSEVGLLIYTVKNDTPVTSIMAADFFRVSKPMIAGMVKSLTKKGYITKEPSQSDKRSYILVPTEKTTQLVDSVYKEYFKVMSLLLSEMGEKKYKDMIELLEEANSILLEGEK